MPGKPIAVVLLRWPGISQDLFIVTRQCTRIVSGTQLADSHMQTKQTIESMLCPASVVRASPSVSLRYAQDKLREARSPTQYSPRYNNSAQRKFSAPTAKKKRIR